MMESAGSPRALLPEIESWLEIPYYQHLLLITQIQLPGHPCVFD